MSSGYLVLTSKQVYGTEQHSSVQFNHVTYISFYILLCTGPSHRRRWTCMIFVKLHLVQSEFWLRHIQTDRKRCIRAHHAYAQVGSINKIQIQIISPPFLVFCHTSVFLNVIGLKEL